MILNKYSFRLFSVCLLLTSINTNLYPQEYYPLQIGNRWDYKTIYYDSGSGSSDTSYSSVVVVGDSLFSNSQTYFVLNTSDLIGGRYVRADGNYIYYYNEYQNEEDTIINLNVAINSPYFPESEFAWSVELLDVDSLNILGVTSNILRYRLDGLILRYLNISDKFGLYHLDSPGEPPGLFTQWATNLYYAIINGEEFGIPLSVKPLQLIPGEFSLSQNYPNPFNPSTIIQYSIGSRQFVSFKVYNVLGKEVATLVNEEKPAGTYEFEFIAKGLQSGVYFYQIKTNSFIETKKMLLLK